MSGRSAGCLKRRESVVADGLGRGKVVLAGVWTRACDRPQPVGKLPGRAQTAAMAPAPGRS